MRRRTLESVLVAAALAIGLCQFAADPVLGQSVPGVNAVSAAPTVPLHNPHGPRPGPPPRNADGHPDLNGMWDFLTGTPVQRPPEFGDTLFLTPEEAAVVHKRLKAVSNTDLVDPGTLPNTDTEDIEFEDVENDAYNKGMNDAWFDHAGPLAQNRTSLVVDPPNGQIPPFTPAAAAQMAKCSGIWQCGPQMMGPREASMKGIKVDRASDRSLSERCLAISNGPPFLSAAYNNNVHILHRKDVVVIQTEMIHTARSVWLDGRPRPDPSVTLWTGYSLGQWEGDTLVIETTNFRPDFSWLGVLHPENFTLVERLTRIDAGTVMYEYTMNDPETWPRPWTVQHPMRKLRGMMYEYACHEGNYGLKFQLMANRGREKQEAAKQGK